MLLILCPDHNNNICMMLRTPNTLALSGHFLLQDHLHVRLADKEPNFHIV